MTRPNTPRRSLFKSLAEGLFQWECRLAAIWASAAHRRLLAAQWGLQPSPEHFDHHIDLHHQWLATRNPMWLERGIFSLLALKGGDVLELSCGDGFNARNFYSLRSKRVVACDIDPLAINTARAKNSAGNVEYVVADVRHDMPAGHFENVVWDFAFPLARYFSQEEIGKVLVEIKARLAATGILSGYTLAESQTSPSNPHAFTTLAELREFLAPHYRNVTVFETFSVGRKNFYFWASDGPLPFQRGWAHALGVDQVAA